MIAVDKINIELINYEEKLGDSILEFKISGNNINNCIVNTLIRVILNDIPIYAFTKYNIDKNTSIFT
jgi:DNA-directed RNA polymerase alpha subunit